MKKARGSPELKPGAHLDEGTKSVTKRRTIRAMRSRAPARRFTLNEGESRVDLTQRGRWVRVDGQQFNVTEGATEFLEPIDRDLDPLGLPRTLMWVTRRGRRQLVVEVTNSTARPDGSRRKYRIPVEPNLRPLLNDGLMGVPQKMTALNAIASTYGLRGEEYVLITET